MDKTVIASVIGLDLNSDIKGITPGVRSTHIPATREYVKAKMVDKKWFTTYNDELLAKIRDHRGLND
jgi:hypothetical protein